MPKPRTKASSDADGAGAFGYETPNDLSADVNGFFPAVAVLSVAVAFPDFVCVAIRTTLSFFYRVLTVRDL